jgi:hypothetical protein
VYLQIGKILNPNKLQFFICTIQPGSGGGKTGKKIERRSFLWRLWAD